ncbi:zinc-binding alcohol dehydrogenase [Pararhodobacter sp. SW119]|uniref:zinc-dependent alcohol dehydrogenase n=1 Tax=Pararhodobacter sp. SW119 TaxID=2780075 RepID=UPI001ADFA0B0|nr:zinc-binding alcohol dehydrogenase [Pararhodobacter sp. SW119]
MSEPRALWIVAPGRAEIRPASLGEGLALRMLWSGISRGTERLVSRGAIPPSEFERMRAPNQEGAFPFPVKYGYAAVARIEEGAEAGQMVFALFPHQTRFRLPPDQVFPLPAALPPQRAIMAANMETALNILWDSGAGAGDRVSVIGAGVVGALVGYLCARLPGCEVTLADIDASRAVLAQKLGCAFVDSANLPPAQDVVINTSAAASALARAFDIAGPGATVVEASWHGATPVELPLGGAFHSQRLRLISSQVGTLPSARLPRWTHRRRLQKALELLLDDRVEMLISGESAFDSLPQDYHRVIEAPGTLCHRIRYD